MRCRGAWIGLRPGIIVEQPHTQTALAKQPGTEQSDRAAARNQHQAAVFAHP